jgi:glutamine synthetase
MDNFKNFLELNYEDLEILNCKAREIKDPKKAEDKHRRYLENEPHIKAVTVCFSDIEGRLHMLDYDKQFLLKSLRNLTFDGSSIRGLSEQQESDLRLVIDWASFTFVPADVFGAGKVIVFANICDANFQPYESDFRGQLQAYAKHIQATRGLEAVMAPEIEGFLLKGVDAEQHYDSETGFELVSSGGYFHSLPLDELRTFIDRVAEAQRAMGFRNEKDHPEVAPSQFEINFSPSDVVHASDVVQLYKLVCRQIAMNMGMTATFLPKPLQAVNGNGMHINFSFQKNGKNVFYDKNGKDNLSSAAWEMVDKLLAHAPEMCLLLNSSVNAYRRLDPAFEAPNHIKASAADRSAMIRIPFGDEKSTRLEIRSVAPDANAYLAMLAILKTSLDDNPPKPESDKRPRIRFLPATIQDSLRAFKASDFMEQTLGASAKQKYTARKQLAANRSPRDLGSRVKASEIIYHHEVTNQHLWNSF